MSYIRGIVNKIKTVLAQVDQYYSLQEDSKKKKAIITVLFSNPSDERKLSALRASGKEIDLHLIGQKRFPRGSDTWNSVFKISKTSWEKKLTCEWSGPGRDVAHAEAQM